MKIKLSPIIRMIPEVDRLTDVVDIEGVQTALVVRSFPTKEEAIANDGVILEEDFDVSGFLSDRAQAEADGEKQRAIDQAQDKVIKKLAHTTDMVLTFLQDKFTLTSQEESFLDNMESIADVITAFKALLSMTPAQETIVEEFHADYRAWIALKQEE